MTIKDARGLAMTGADAATAAAFETALAEFQCYVGNPVGTIEAALQARPDFTMGHVLRGCLYGSGAEAPGMREAASPWRPRRHCRPMPAKTQHIAALQALASGALDTAVERWEHLLVEYPRDILALQIAHLLDFFRGDARNLRDRIARRLHAWTKADPAYHAVLGMHAFGLEEMGEYDRAEERGREAVGLNPRDGWAYHAVAHVLEMRNLPEGGIRWLSSSSARWSAESFFKVHNWWHLALFHLELDNVDEVLNLYDGPIRGERSAVALDTIDASALLWRLYLRGHDVGDRWREVADAWTPTIDDGIYAFNDVHALMAYAAIGDGERIEPPARYLAAQRRGGHRQQQPCHGARGWLAGRRGAGRVRAGPVRRHHRAAAASAAHRASLRRQPRAARPDRSHPDRSGAPRSGDRNLFAALASERGAGRPRSPLARRYRDATLAA